jgi:hypothetical protein
MMKSTKPRTATETNRDDAARKKAADRSSAGTTGGAPASEEDIGTEGAGTEPRESADTTSPSSEQKQQRPGRSRS